VNTPPPPGRPRCPAWGDACEGEVGGAPRHDYLERRAVAVKCGGRSAARGGRNRRRTTSGHFGWRKKKAPGKTGSQGGRGLRFGSGSDWTVGPVSILATSHDPGFDFQRCSQLTMSPSASVPTGTPSRPAEARHHAPHADSSARMLFANHRRSKVNSAHLVGRSERHFACRVSAMAGRYEILENGSRAFFRFRQIPSISAKYVANCLHGRTVHAFCVSYWNPASWRIRLVLSARAITTWPLYNPHDPNFRYALHRAC
jgi:hypothetical protein